MEEPLETLIDRLNSPTPTEFALGTIFRLWFDALPYPAWMKFYHKYKDTFRMAYMNPMYTLVTGIEKIDYVRGSDNNVWPQKTADNYEENDRIVIDTMKPNFCEELSGPFHFKGVKWPNNDTSDEVIAVNGMMEDLNGNRAITS